MRGESPEGGIFPIALAGQPIHIAAPIPSVRVGVINIRRKLVGELTPKYHPAPDVALHIHVNCIGDAGQTTGI